MFILLERAMMAVEQKAHTAQQPAMKILRSGRNGIWRPCPAEPETLLSLA
jgi:hypothetical protein